MKRLGSTARMALRNVFRQRRRSVLLMGAIGFGVMTISVAQGFTEGLIRTAHGRVLELLGGHVYVEGREVTTSGSLVSLVGDEAVLEEALSLAGDQVEAVFYRSTALGEMIFVSRVRPVSLTGVDWEAEARLVESLDVVEGETHSLADPASIMLPVPLAAELGVRVGESVLVRLTGVAGQLNVGEFTVGGLLGDSGLIGIDTVYADKTYLNRLLGMESRQYQQAILSVGNAAAVTDVAETVAGRFSAHGRLTTRPPSVFGEQADRIGRVGIGPGAMIGSMSSMAPVRVDESARWEGTRFEVTTIHDVMEPLMMMLDVLGYASLALYVVLLSITMVGLLNTFRMILIERTSEIGTIRALGMQRGQVRDLVLLEALSLALGGALVGLAAAFLAGAIASSIPVGTRTPLAVFLDGGSFVFSFNVLSLAGNLAVLTAVTLLSAYLPARQAALIHPADALRTSY